MKLTVDEEILEAARKVGPIVDHHAEAAEQGRRLAAPVVEALAGAGLFRLLTPQSLGGLETDPVTCAAAIEEVARVDSAAGWALMSGNAVDWWLARLSDEGAEEIYARGADVVVAAAFAPPLEARAVAGGYCIAGRRGLASNVEDATWLMVTAVVGPSNEAGSDAGQEAIGAIVRADQLEIVDTWDSLGMRGTGSHDVVLRNVLVPRRRTFPLVPGFSPGVHYGGALYRLPAMGLVAAVIPPVALAIARQAIDELHRLAAAKTPFGSASVLAGRVATQGGLARAEAQLRSARILFYDTLAEAWARTVAGVVFSLEDKADLLLAACHAVRSSVETVEVIFALAGTSAVYAGSPIERHFRDVQTLRQHGFTAESRYETVGQVYLGVAPEFGFVAF